MASRHKARQIAVQALYSWDVTRPDPADLCRFDWVDEEIDTTFARLVVQGVLENIASIDTLIREHLKHWDFDRVNKVDLAILRVSVYFLRHQPTIPASITIDEAIELAKEFSGEESYRFVNGILDAIHQQMRLVR